MSFGALVRAARQQGQRRLLALKQALAEGQLQHGQQQRQQQPGAAQHAAWSCLAAPAAAAPTPWLPRAAAWQQQQARGYALRGRWRPRPKDVMPDRNLPQRNEQIRAREVRVLFPAEEEKQPEVMPTPQALKLARSLGVDLVMVSPKAEPPVTRLVEWSKVLYEAQKRDKAATKARLAQQRASEAKEVRIGCQIAEHDLAVKMGQARRFLEDGAQLRLVVTFKGGPQIQLGRDVTLYLIGQLADLCKVKDERHLQRPMKGHWAVMLEPLPPPSAAALAKKKAAEDKGSGAGEAGTQAAAQQQ